MPHFFRIETGNEEASFRDKDYLEVFQIDRSVAIKLFKKFSARLAKVNGRFCAYCHKEFTPKDGRIKTCNPRCCKLEFNKRAAIRGRRMRERNKKRGDGVSGQHVRP